MKINISEKNYNILTEIMKYNNNDIYILVNFLLAKHINKNILKKNIENKEK